MRCDVKGDLFEMGIKLDDKYVSSFVSEQELEGMTVDQITELFYDKAMQAYAAAVAVAPVTDWRYYDTVYAERYMLTPQQNADGYKASAPMTRARNLACPLLLMSGTADDNVHLSNTMEYVSALQNEGILCDMYLFPNMNHSINGCNARAVVYARMLEFFNSKLK